jgi:hypothetical protein
MRRAIPLALVALVLGGCGGGSNTGADGPAPTPIPTPPDSEQLKYDLLTAQIQLDAYKLEEKTYTADETQLGPAFPNTVTIKSADADDYYMAAYDDQHIRYVLRKTGDTVERTCDPPTADACPDGQW